MTDVEFYESRMRADREECRKAREEEENKKTAKKLRSIYDAFTDEGFTDEQAFKMLMALIEKAWQKA